MLTIFYTEHCEVHIDIRVNVYILPVRGNENGNFRKHRRDSKEITLMTCCMLVIII
jgi:hypothetical protein